MCGPLTNTVSLSSQLQQQLSCVPITGRSLFSTYMYIHVYTCCIYMYTRTVYMYMYVHILYTCVYLHVYTVCVHVCTVCMYSGTCGVRSSV